MKRRNTLAVIGAIFIFATPTAYGQAACTVNGQTLKVGDIYEERWAIPPDVWQTIFWKVTDVTDHGDGTCWVTMDWAGDAVKRHTPGTPEYVLAFIEQGVELEVMFVPDGPGVMAMLPSYATAALYANTSDPNDQIFITINSEGAQWDIDPQSGTFTGLQFSALVAQDGEPLAAPFDIPVEGDLVAVADEDDDGVPDSMDNCLASANEAQRDSDGDGLGNRCDADIALPNNCVVNVTDLGALRAAFFSVPDDPHWNPDADLDGDSAVNATDLGIMKSQFFLPPGPSGVPNLCVDGETQPITIAASNFDGGFDGWEATSGVQWNPDDGAPGGHLMFTDGAVVDGGLLFSPQPFLGDLSLSDRLEFDFRFTEVPAPSLEPLVTISGPAGSASRGIPLSGQLDVWDHHSFELDAALWGMDPALWSALLQDVTQVSISMSASSSPGEITGIDNVALLAQRRTSKIEIGPNVGDVPQNANCTIVGTTLSCVVLVGGACTPDTPVRVDATILASPQGVADFVQGKALCSGFVVANSPLANGPAPFTTTQTATQTNGIAACELTALNFPGVKGEVLCTF